MSKKIKYIIVGDNNFWYSSGEGNAKEIEEGLNEVKSGLKDYPTTSLPTKLYVYSGILVREVICHV